MKEQLCEQGGGLCCGLEETQQKKVNEKEIMLELVTMWFEKKHLQAGFRNDQSKKVGSYRYANKRNIRKSPY